MTIALSLKVNDGVVLAADSAATLAAPDLIQVPGIHTVFNIYNNANKVFNLLKGKPIGMITWGTGAIGNASISTLAKDLRSRFKGEDPLHEDWEIKDDDPITTIAERVRQFMYDELYVPAFDTWPNKPDLGFVIAGYSPGATMAEEYQITIAHGICEGPTPLRSKEECGLTWNGQPEAISRLVLGFSPLLPLALEQNLGVPHDQIREVMEILQQVLAAPIIPPPMPIQDAIELAEFLIETTIKFTRFMPGASTVGGPIEIAVITKHEGFKWVKRKHYYHSTLNPQEEER